ncbi:MAG: hypothetical protein KTR13_09465, partial [Saprospiraceae bacterium]|nr:hypothetical protein [Saprospiraceae bacterium]
VKAIGWSMPEYECVQVSTNLTNYKATSVFEVFATINHLAKEHGTLIKETELIGLIPKDALDAQGYSLESAIQTLKLSSERNGDMEARILDLDMI